MKQVRVVFEPEGIVVEGQAGELLLDLALAAGLPLLSECGGQGTCGSCRVQVQSGRVRFLNRSGLEEEIATPQEVLACQTAAAGDLVVHVPPATRLCPPDERITGYMGPAAAAFLRPGRTGFPLGERISVQLSPPSFDDPTPDWERLLAGLKEAGYGHRNIAAGLDVLRQMPPQLRALDFSVSATLVDEGCHHRLIALGQPEQEEALGLAVDIGTSNVKAELVQLRTGRVLAGAAQVNAQVRYGEDVISRIIWVQEHEHGAEQLQDAVTSTVNGLIEELLQEAGASQDQIIAVSCAGNATMISFRLGIPADAIRRAPHIAPVGLPPVISGGSMGLQVHPEAVVLCLPAINGYVGGDITGGILATGLFEADSLTLLIDVGTNGEIVIGSKDWMVCCSCSAGPAFEGVGIECGLPARPGAIESLAYDTDQDRTTVRTIGDHPPIGLCGNGLVETLASLLDAGVIDRAGNLVTDFPSARMREVNGEPQFVLLWEDDTATDKDLVLRQGEIDNLIRAKAAVFAAVSTLLEELGLDIAQIDRLYLAGAFGSHLDVRTAVEIGLLPDLPAERITVAGNTALVGAYITLLSSEAREEVSRLARATTYIDLSTSSHFMEEFVAAQMLPHTDLERFPSVVSGGQSRAGDSSSNTNHSPTRSSA